MQTPPELSTIDYSKFITWGMSGLALVLAALSLYLQRRDKKPRLIVEPQLGIRPIELKIDDAGGHCYLDD